MTWIILAEDDEVVGEIARHALIDAGNAVALLINGKDALAVIGSGHATLSCSTATCPS